MTLLLEVGHAPLPAKDTLSKLPKPYLPKIYEKVLADYMRQAREGLWITLDADSAKPSGWLGVLGVGNPHSIAVLAEHRHSGWQMRHVVARKAAKGSAFIDIGDDRIH